MRLSLAVALACLATASLAAQDLARLQKDLRSRDVATRLAAATQLAALGPAAAKAIRPLQAALADTDPAVAMAAGCALGSIGPAAIKSIRRSLGDRSCQLAAMRAVEELGPAGAELVPDLLLALREETLELNEAAGKAVVKIGASATPHLIGGLKRRVSSYSAVVMLRELGAEASGATDALIALIDDGSDLPLVLSDAATTLGRIGDPAAVPALTRALGKPQDESLVTAAADALGHIGPAATASVAALIEVLTNKRKTYTPTARGRAARALGSIGSLDTAAVEAVHAASTDDNLEVRTAAESALLVLAPPPGIDGHLARLRHRDPSLRYLAVVALGELGDAARPHIARLVDRAVKDTDRGVRLAALRSIAALGGVAPGEAAALQPLIAGDDEELAQAAKAALPAGG